MIGALAAGGKLAVPLFEGVNVEHLAPTAYPATSRSPSHSIYECIRFRRGTTGSASPIKFT